MKFIFKKYRLGVLVSVLILISTLPIVGKSTVYLKQDTIRLDNKHRQMQMQVTAQTIRKAPDVLDVPITQIRNQNKIPLVIRIKMIWGEPNSSNKKVIGICNLSLFPPAQVGVYSQQISKVFEHVNMRPEEIEKGEKEVALVFEITPVTNEKSLKNVEVVIDPVRWKTHQRQLFSEN